MDCHCVSDGSSPVPSALPHQAKPLRFWKHAQLDDVRNFLRAERDAGRFVPLLERGLD